VTLYLDSLPIELVHTSLEQFCQRWQVQELYLFGSVLRDDFRDDSDIDVMISFKTAAGWGLMALVKMQQELEILFGRDVDLLTKASIEQSHNWIRRHDILSTAQLVYAATS
jgi:predicted nucleotidyltransferase